MTEADSDVTSPFQAIGGRDAVDRIVDLFYDRMDTLPEAQTIRAMHPADLSGIRSLFKKYLAEWLGGPPAYSDERGHPRLRRRHLPFAIGAAERDAWMLCMNGALDEVIADKELRENLSRQLLGVADWMRNIEG